jgi:hypothetical protein
MKKIFTLIAVFAAILSANAVEIFRFELASDAPNLEIAFGDNEVLGYHTTNPDYTAYTCTEGGSIDINNGHSSKNANMINGGKLSLNNSGGSYIIVTLPKGVTLKTGDVIKLLNGSAAGGAINFDEGKKMSSDNMDANNEYTVPADGDGLNKFVIWRGAGKPTFTGIVVERNENQTVAPAISVAGGKVVMTCATEGASIYYATATGVTPATGTLYSEPLAITENVTYYAVAVKEGMEVSKEVSKVIEYYAIPAEATLEATLKAPKILGPGESDEALESLVDGNVTAVKVEDDAVLSNSGVWNENQAFSGLVKVKKTITIATTGEKSIFGIKVKGISNADGNGQAVTAEGMKFTTDGNILPARDEVTEPGVVELVAETPAKEFKVYFSGQARVLFEVYTGTATGIETVKAQTIDLNGAIYNLAGQKVSNDFKGLVIKNGKKFVVK